MHDMDSTQRISRHGYNLMSLASIGQFVCFGLLIWNLGVRQWAPETASSLAGADWWLFAALATAVWLSQFWALVRLRAIGKLLHADSHISHAMAEAWQRFGKALVVNAVLMAFPVGTAVPEPGNGLNLVLRLDAGGLYFVVIACLCIFSIAQLLEQAATLRDENEAIV